MFVEPRSQQRGRLTPVSQYAEAGHIHCPQPRITAWMNGIERPLIHIHVQADAVITTSAPDFKPKRGDFRAVIPAADSGTSIYKPGAPRLRQTLKLYAASVSITACSMRLTSSRAINRRRRRSSSR